MTTENQKVFNISNNPATENSTSNTVANSNGSGIIDNKKEPLYKPVTLSSLSKIPKMNIFEDNKLNTLHLQANRNLLVKVFQSNEPVGTEFSIVYGENMKLIDKSDEKGNKIGTYTYHKGIVGRTKIENPGVPYHAFHNHGSGKTFSFPDIFGFARTENMISLTAVGNTGSKFVLYRNSNSDNQGYENFVLDKSKEIIYSANKTDFTLKMLDDIQKGKKDIIKNLSDKQLSELENAMIRKIEECLKGGKKYGIEYISSET